MQRFDFILLNVKNKTIDRKERCEKKSCHGMNSLIPVDSVGVGGCYGGRVWRKKGSFVLIKCEAFTGVLHFNYIERQHGGQVPN